MPGKQVMESEFKEMGMVGDDGSGSQIGLEVATIPTMFSNASANLTFDLQIPQGSLKNSGLKWVNKFVGPTSSYSSTSIKFKPTICG